jgi:UTP:GlnB (protein PII) uridylyltransferase
MGPDQGKMAMSETADVLKQLEDKHREVLDSLNSQPEDRDRFLKLFKEEGELIDRLHELFMKDVTIPVDK